MSQVRDLRYNAVSVRTLPEGAVIATTDDFRATGRLVHSRPWLIALAMALLALATPIQGFASAVGTVQATYAINVRSCPRLDCQVIGSANLGDTMPVRGELVNGFYPVLWYGREGFVYGLYLASGEEAPWFVEGDPGCREVALVFNIGIGREPSQEIVSTLIEREVPASMFPMGWWAREYPDFLLMLDEAGFVIGTHGDQPLYLTGEADEMVAHDVSNSVRTIETILRRDIDQYFTPYAADTDARVRGVVSELGLLPVGWSVSAADYGPDVTEEEVYARVMDNVYPGAVIEMHLDGPATAQSTAMALPRIIDDLRAEGYTFATVPDLLIPCEGATVGR